MRRFLRFLRVSAAAWLLAGHAALALGAPAADELLAPFASAYLRVVQPGEDAARHVELFENVFTRVERSFARKVDMGAFVAVAVKTLEEMEPQSGEPAAVFAKAVNAALASLDPYSRYLDPRAALLHRSAMQGSFGGLGLRVEMAEGLVRIVAPIPGTPAARAGLQSGDLIVRFDDRPVLGMTLAEAVTRLKTRFRIAEARDVAADVAAVLQTLSGKGLLRASGMSPAEDRIG